MAKDFYFQDPWQWLSLYASIMFMLRFFAAVFSSNDRFKGVVRGVVNVKFSMSNKSNSSGAEQEKERESLLKSVGQLNQIARMEDMDIILFILNGLSGIVFCLTGIFVNLWFNDALTGKGIPPGFMDLDDKVRMGYSLSAFILMLLDIPAILYIVYFAKNRELLISTATMIGAVEVAGGWCTCGSGA